MPNRERPTFNLKAVVQETGLKPDTLRAWERRYGLPHPNRTSGGHRLYSQHDINMLKWLLERQHEGLSISRAVEMWRNFEAENRDPLQAIPLSEIAQATPPLSPVELGNMIVELRQSWIEACMAFDEHRAELALAQAFSYYPPETVCFELLQKALSEIGNRWYSGEATVQQEHFASALALRRLDAMLAAVPVPTRSGRLLVGCPPGENHTFGPLLITLLLRRRGWHVVYLGADLPINHLHTTINSTKPDLAIFSAQSLETAASLLNIARYLQENDVPVAYGGYIFNRLPELQQRIPGHFLGAEISRIPPAVERLIATPPALPPTQSLDPQYEKAHDYFLQRMGLIHSYILERLDPPQISDYVLNNVRDFLTRSITAALRLGNLDYINADLKWVEGLIANYDMPAEQLAYYLALYHEAAERYLTAPEGQLITAWLANIRSVFHPN